MQMCAESENLHFSHVFFQHGYLTYYSTYLLENLYVYLLDLFLKLRKSKYVTLAFDLIFSE